VPYFRRFLARKIKSRHEDRRRRQIIKNRPLEKRPESVGGGNAQGGHATTRRRRFSIALNSPARCGGSHNRAAFATRHLHQRPKRRPRPADTLCGGTPAAGGIIYLGESQKHLNRLSPFSRYETMELRPKTCSACIWASPKETMTPADFAEFLRRNGLSYDAATAQLQQF
jgi:hypothetical protein